MLTMTGGMVDLKRAELLGVRGKTAEALALCRPIREALARRANDVPDISIVRVRAGQANYVEGRVAFLGLQIAAPSERPGLLAAAEERLEEARSLFIPLADQPVPEPEAREGVAQVCQLLGVIYRERGKPGVAAERTAEAVRRFEALRKMFPDNPQHATDLAAAYNTSGSLYQKVASDFDKAAAEYDRARRLLEDLMKQYPDNPRLRHMLAVARGNLGGMKAAKAPADGTPLLERAVADLEELIRTFPDVAEYAAALDMERFRLATFLTLQALKDGTLAPATVTLHERALGLFKALATRPNPYPKARESYDRQLKVYGMLLRERGVEFLQANQFTEAVRFLERAVAAWEECRSPELNEPKSRDYFTKMRLGLMLACQGRVKALDPAKPADRVELRRVAALGMTAFDRLPADLRQAAEIAAVRDYIRKRLDAIPK
jgi:tetratricopeptide (TPR) repeat protein